ncbi:CHAT domain-containing protein [Streptomyces sp. NPDC051105]|uniref:CHAT domain-containing protein n=1 Tax=Streptomyces sp. NPDC051105 TaxID=3154843 RepID=UPI003430E457
MCLSDREQAAGWFRDALDQGTDDPPPGIGGPDAALFEAAVECMTLPDGVTAALRAADLRARVAEAGWHQLAALLDVVRLLPALGAPSHIEALTGPVQTPDWDTSHFLTMIEERPPNPSDALSLLPVFIVGAGTRPRSSRAPEAVDWPRCERLLDQVEKLMAAADQTGLSALAETAGLRFQDGLTLLTAAAGKRGKWPLALRLRARYRVLNRPSQPPADPSQDRSQTIQKLAASLAKMHDIGVRHGSLLLENVGADGRLSNFSETQSRDQRVRDLIDSAVDALDAPDRLAEQVALVEGLRAELWEPDTDDDVEWLVGDLIPLRHQLDEAEWAAAAEQYVTAAQSSRARDVVSRVDAAVSQEQIEAVLDSLPRWTPDEPHLEIRLAAIVARHDPDADPCLEAALADALARPSAAERAHALIELITICDLVDWRVQDRAIDVLLHLLEEMTAQGAPAEADAIAEFGARAAGAIGHRPLQTALSRVCGQNRPDESRPANEPDLPSQDVLDVPEFLSEEALRMLGEQDWARASILLSAELDEHERRDPAGLPSLLTAGYLGLALSSSIELHPDLGEGLALQILRQGVRFGPGLLAAVRGPQRAGHRLVLNAAANLGHAMAAHFSDHRASREVLQLAADLLAETLLRTDPDHEPLTYSTRANNLALCQMTVAEMHQDDERITTLHKAHDLFLEATRIDEENVGRGGDTRFIDYSNLGATRMALALATYDAQTIDHKPVESAHWYRSALEAYHHAAELADQSGSPEHQAAILLKAAAVTMDLCDRYALERYWAGGDLTKAFYDWLRAFAGDHIRTDWLLSDWAGSALASISHAARIAVGGNPTLVLTCVEAAVRLWSLGQWRNGIPRAHARHALALLVELTDALEDSGMFAAFPDQLSEVAELRPLWQALALVDAHAIGSAGEDQLSLASRMLQNLGRSRSPLLRALALPYRLSHEFERRADGLLVNGLFVEPDDDRLSLVLPSLQRAVQITGLRIDELRCERRDVHHLRTVSLNSLRHLSPMVSWDDLPGEVLVARGTGTIGSTPVSFEAFRLPTGTWETWLVNLAHGGNGDTAIGLNMPYQGLYDPISGTLDTSATGNVTDDVHVLVFGEQGITIEVGVPFAEAGEVLAEDHGLIMRTREIDLLIKSTPRIASSDAAFIVKDDGSTAASVCAASFTHATPSISFPANAVHTFSPLYYFRDRLDTGARSLLNEVRPREIVLVGVPDDIDDAIGLLSDLFDARRGLLWLVEPDEADRAAQAQATFVQRLEEAPGARYLLRAASSANTAYRPADHLQIVIVPRDLAAAAAQIGLDLAAARRRDTENVPVVLEGRPTYINTKGNPVGARLLKILFDGPVEWDTYLDRYVSLLGTGVHGQAVLYSSPQTASVFEVLHATMARRPVHIRHHDEPAAIAALPHARLTGALVLPPNDESFALLEHLNPPEVHIRQSLTGTVPSGPWTVLPLPEDPAAIALMFQELAREDHGRRIADLPRTHPHLVGSTELLAETGPADYVLLGPRDPAQRPYAYLAANYAASLNAPLYLMAEPIDPLIGGRAETLATAGSGNSRSPVSRDFLAEEADTLPTELADLFPATLADLDLLSPTYVSLVTPFAGFPIELIGAPPLATRFALGRLAGPDLASTALLIARAALSEDITRPVNVHAVLADCSDAIPDKTVPDARAEILALRDQLAAQPRVHVRLVDDLTGFLQTAPGAAVLHFAGHCRFVSDDPDRSGLVFREGILTASTFTAVLGAHPLVFGNACESGLLTPTTSSDGVLWTGIAAAFLAAGAGNYLGSLWPVFDTGSRLFAEVFYTTLWEGMPVGEALRHARLDAYERGDPTWSAYALYGCPRNRFRPPSSAPPAPHPRERLTDGDPPHRPTEP